ncbi:MAG: hypothetical protein C5B51_05435 [Terriglobia bacterium]|nr:MAG: hypothetical protein C5B51_05435 [Terriglobia bacterium]
MSSQPNSFLTPEEYLELERRAVHKSEYLHGEMFAMSGGGAQFADDRRDTLLALAEVYDKVEWSGPEGSSAAAL